MLGILAGLVVQKWLFAWIVAGAPVCALSWLVLRRWRRAWAVWALCVVGIFLGAAFAGVGTGALALIAAHTGWVPFPPREFVSWMRSVIGWGMAWGFMSVLFARLIIGANEPEPWDQRQRHPPAKP